MDHILNYPAHNYDETNFHNCTLKMKHNDRPTVKYHARVTYGEIISQEIWADKY